MNKREENGCPTTVEGNFNCSSNQLKSLEGCPTTVTGNFDCSSNRRQFTVEEVKALCDVKGRIIIR